MVADAQIDEDGTLGVVLRVGDYDGNDVDIGRRCDAKLVAVSAADFSVLRTHFANRVAPRSLSIGLCCAGT